MGGGTGKDGALWFGKEKAEVGHDPNLQRSTSGGETGCITQYSSAF